MRGGEREPPLVARESHVRPKEGLSPVGDAETAEVRHKPDGERRIEETWSTRARKIPSACSGCSSEWAAVRRMTTVNELGGR